MLTVKKTKQRKCGTLPQKSDKMTKATGVTLQLNVATKDSVSVHDTRERCGRTKRTDPRIIIVTAVLVCLYA